MTAERISSEERYRMIAEAAYFRAERRGFDGGDPLADWVEAEAEIDERIKELENGAWLERLEKRLATATRKTKELHRKVAGMQAEARAAWQEDLDWLARLRDALEERLAEIREQGRHATERAREQAESLWEQISDAVERVTARARAGGRKDG